jgi:LPPG:FO 2-phospho-L-lactate transferase
MLSSPIVAVSPIVGGQAIKGPAAKIMTELGLPSSAMEVAKHYRGLIDGFVIDETDAAQADDISTLGMKVKVAQTVMRDLDDRKRLATECCDFAATFPS